MNHEYCIGIDTSKKKLDICVTKNNKKVHYTKVANSRKGFKALEKELTIPLSEALVCVENTGFYNYHLLKWISQKGYTLWLAGPLNIKKSIGLHRGKNDKIDAGRIATYAYRHQDECQPWIPQREVIEELEELRWAREKLIKSISQYEKPINEKKEIIGEKTAEKTAKLFSHTLAALRKDLKEVDKKIKMCIAKDKKVDRLFKILMSIPGIGETNAIALLVTTNEFKKITDPKKLACFSGIAPFEHTSGTSIRGKSRVSHFASKKLKQLLHMAAMSVIRLPGELADFYKRLLARGKAKMVAINAVRRKLIHIIYACIRDNRMYEKNYTKNLQMS